MFIYKNIIGAIGAKSRMISLSKLEIIPDIDDPGCDSQCLCAAVPLGSGTVGVNLLLQVDPTFVPAEIKTF